MIARALMHDPRVLLLDEPTTGLDPQARRALWDTLRGLQQRGLTIILTTHYMEEADRLCQRLAIIDHGAILTIDTPAALKRSLPGGHLLDVWVRSGAARRAPGSSACPACCAWRRSRPPATPTAWSGCACSWTPATAFSTASCSPCARAGATCTT